ncbi:MAG: SLC13 family permease [Alphaproteobacteria bacterium]
MTTVEIEEKKSRLGGFPLNSLVILAAGFGALYYYQAVPAAVILILSAIVVLLIIFGERFKIDLWLESRGIPGREAILPMIAMALAIHFGAVHLDTIPRVFAEKIDIIVFILSFAIIAEGIGRSGYFAFAAYKIVYKCQGNTTRLILYLFILTSILTLFTSNDIVVLVLTPIIISVCVHAGIRNTRLLLLAQFMAANTLSMGLLIGSPTNIILGKALNIDFFEYFGLMIVPAILSCMLSMIVIDWMNHQSKPGTSGLFVKRWSYSDNYRVPAFAKSAHFTDSMQRWLVLFLVAVAWLAVVSAMEWSLFWSAIPTALISFYYLYKDSVQEKGSPAEATKDLVHMIRFLPYSVFFFAMCFFVFAAEMAQLDYVEKVVLPFVRTHFLDDIVHASLSMTFLSGVVVNMLNDLPAAALLSEMLQQMEASGGALNEYMRIVIIQAFLVGLNIGCYVTPIGALAGILWFDILKKEERRQRKLMEQHGGGKQREMLIPNRMDMVRYGLMHFVFVSLVIGYLLPFFIQVVDMLISSPEQSNNSPLNGILSIKTYLPYIGIGLLAFTFLTFRNVLRRGNVLLGHMREVFVVMTKVTIWAMKNRGLYFAVMSAILLAGASGLLYWSEAAHDSIYGAAGQKPLFDSVSGFILWVMVFTGSGMSEAFKPHSTLGLALTSVLPLMVIGGIVLMARLSTDKSVTKLSKRLANGEIPSYRIVIINYNSRFESFVRNALYTKDASILLLCDHAQYDQALSFASETNQTHLGSHRLYAAVKHPDPYHNFHEYRIEQADEIYLLSDMTTQGEYEKLRYVTKLDALLNSTRVTAVEAVDAGVTGSGHDNASEADLDDLAGMPRIFIETPSERFRELLQRSSSPLMLRTAIQATFDSDVGDYLMSDMDESLSQLNGYYHTGRPSRLPQLFIDGKSPLEKFSLRDFELDAKGKDLFRHHFAGLDPSKEGHAQHMRALRQFSIGVRAGVAEKTAGAKYLEGKEAKPLDYSRLMGLGMRIGDSLMHIGIPSAALSMQAIKAEKIIMRMPADQPVEGSAPALSEDGKVFIYNFTPHSKSFVERLLPLYKGSKKPRVVIMAFPDQVVPDSIRESNAVHILQYAQTEEMINHICPIAEKKKSATKEGFKPVLQKGDRIYVFLDFDRPNPDTPSIDFIDRLDRQLHLQSDQPGALTHPDLYIVVETANINSRSLFENFFLDKIIDSSLPRQSYMEVLSKIFHRSLSDKTLLGFAHGTVSHFHLSSKIAAYLCRYFVKYAEDVSLKDQTGAEIRVTGKTFAQAVHEIRSYSMPPMQLVARVRLVPHAEQMDKHVRRTFRLAEIPESEPIQDGDLLLNIPML